MIDVSKKWLVVVQMDEGEHLTYCDPTRHWFDFGDDAVKFADAALSACGVASAHVYTPGHRPGKVAP